MLLMNEVPLCRDGLVLLIVSQTSWSSSLIKRCAPPQDRRRGVPHSLEMPTPQGKSQGPRHRPAVGSQGGGEVLMSELPF